MVVSDPFCRTSESLKSSVELDAVFHHPPGRALARVPAAASRGTGAPKTPKTGAGHQRRNTNAARGPRKKKKKLAKYADRLMHMAKGDSVQHDAQPWQHPMSNLGPTFHVLP